MADEKCFKPSSDSPKLASRDNQGKPELTQVTRKYLSGTAEVLMFGAKKYSRNNWRKGQPVTKILDSALRHLFFILDGEDFDTESGLPHWAHVSANMMFLAEQQGREDLDDRFRVEVDMGKDAIKKDIEGEQEIDYPSRDSTPIPDLE